MLTQLMNKTKKMGDIIVVSGLPRSGTSMMMNMLEAGGIPLLTDNIRTANLDNPKGYYEFERVKNLETGDTDWVKDARGRAVKVISSLLEYLPAQYAYKVIFMERHLSEILASQKAMLLRRGEDTDKVTDEQMAAMFTKHLGKVKGWLSQQHNIRVLYICYNDILDNPGVQVEIVNRFLGGGLDVLRMSSIADQVLYRQRKVSGG